MTYIEILESYNLSTLQWLAISFAVFILGVSKAGLKGISIFIVIIMAFVFGEKASTGVLLPMLIIADILAVTYYNQHANWSIIKKLIPWMIVGVLVGVWVGNDISEMVFKRLMAIIVLISVGIMLFTERLQTNNMPNNKFFSAIMGFLTGFTTMVGNLAGPISNVYFLAIRFKKNEFIGTAAWLFFLINLFKLPFHIFVWETVTVKTLVLNSVLIPASIIGFFTGAYIVKLISNVNYRKFILIITAIAGILLFIR
ncbi:sulfite exporter TauE/SafE family protein [Tamlana sp. 62-3]|uniref:Probable membrane transporter protein n=1 Tax=Neotamlana sargassicola TaxID=2883125 RepID=A0A9X1I6V3_9FLAO|nr:sulfite exporter TauE/SafE family protein [Tamlana sargassicola]MCB4807459.1 sulfite exporter TauE/SafE family protein [Tamlana sargassicola]